MRKIIFFPENLIFLGFAGKFGLGRVTLNAGIFFIWHKNIADLY